MTSDVDQLDPWGRLKIGDIIYQSAVAVLRTIEENEEMLGLLDAHSGDGDHGRTIVFGLRAAVGEMAPTGPPGVRIIEAGRAFLDASGGAAGALYGSLIQAIGGALVAGQGTAAAVRAGVDRVKSLGKAEVGDKTMIDALEPFCDEFEGRLAAGMQPRRRPRMQPRLPRLWPAVAGHPNSESGHAAVRTQVRRRPHWRCRP